MHGSNHACIRSTGRVGVLEIDPTGHRLIYVRHLHDAAGPGRCVVFAPANVDADDEFHAHLAEASAVTVPVGTGSRRQALNDAVDRAVELGVEQLVIPEGDHYVVPLLTLLLTRSLRRRGHPALSFRLVLLRSSTLGGPEPATAAMVVKPLAVAVLRRLASVRVHFLTDALGVVRARRGFPGVTGVRDPVAPVVEGGDEAPPWLPAAVPGRVRVGVLGVISARKNVPLLLEAATADPGLVLVVAGRLEPDVAALLAADPRGRTLQEDGRLVVVDRILEPAEFSAALAEVDVVAILHDNDAPSGILAEACVRCTPSVVPAGAWLARVVEASGIGRATELSAPAVAATLRAAHESRAAHLDAMARARPGIGTEDFTSTLLAAT